MPVGAAELALETPGFGSLTLRVGGEFRAPWETPLSWGVWPDRVTLVQGRAVRFAALFCVAESKGNLRGMMDRQNDQERVRLDVFQGEPLALLAVQRLRDEGIPCLMRSLGVGPGGWGMAANLPYAVYVLADDDARAREVLELPVEEGRGPVDQGQLRRWGWSPGVMVVLLLIAVAVLVSAVDGLFGLLLR